MWRREMGILQKEANKDLRAWADMVLDVTMVLERINLDYAPSSSDENDVAAPSASKRLKVAAPPSDEEMPDAAPIPTTARPVGRRKTAGQQKRARARR
jgi:hypothetical protein